MGTRAGWELAADSQRGKAHRVERQAGQGGRAWQDKGQVEGEQGVVGQQQEQAGGMSAWGRGGGKRQGAGGMGAWGQGRVVSSRGPAAWEQVAR